MIPTDFANRADKLDPIATGDKIANWCVCLVVLFGCNYLLLWLAGGM